MHCPKEDEIHSLWGFWVLARFFLGQQAEAAKLGQFLGGGGGRGSEFGGEFWDAFFLQLEASCLQPSFFACNCVWELFAQSWSLLACDCSFLLTVGTSLLIVSMKLYCLHWERGLSWDLELLRVTVCLFESTYEPLADCVCVSICISMKRTTNLW